MSHHAELWVAWVAGIGSWSDHRQWIDRHFPTVTPLQFWTEYNIAMMECVDQFTTLEQITTDPEHAAGVFANLTRGRIDPRHVFDLMADVGVVNTHYEPMREAEELWAAI